MDDFSKANIGDILWSIQFGDCEVIDIDNHTIRMKSISSLWHLCYRFDGKYSSDEFFQSLFWSNPNIIPPHKPKQKIKGVLERWVAVYNDKGQIFDSTTYDTFDECALKTIYNSHNPYQKNPSQIVKIEIPYEIEED